MKVSPSTETKDLPAMRPTAVSTIGEAISAEARSISQELIKAIAAEIGASTVAYVEVMYPEAIKATSSTFKLSLRNHIHNEIVAMAKLHDELAMMEAIANSAAFRKKWVAQYRKLRRTKR